MGKKRNILDNVIKEVRDGGKAVGDGAGSYFGAFDDLAKFDKGNAEKIWGKVSGDDARATQKAEKLESKDKKKKQVLEAKNAKDAYTKKIGDAGSGRSGTLLGGSSGGQAGLFKKRLLGA
jgi:hypothetical protein